MGVYPLNVTYVPPSLTFDVPVGLAELEAQLIRSGVGLECQSVKVLDLCRGAVVPPKQEVGCTCHCVVECRRHLGVPCVEIVTLTSCVVSQNI